MGSNEIPNTKRATVKLWQEPEDGSGKFVTSTRRGRPPGTSNKDQPPKTPVQGLRMLLGVNQHEWARILGVSIGTVTHVARGKAIPTVALAKRMQEEARQRGIAVTLDELYQHVVPHGEIEN